MNALNFVGSNKYVKYTQGLNFLVFCGIRLVLPITNLVYVAFLYTMVIFLILPIGLWGYFQKTTRLFESCYVRTRLQDKEINCYFLNVIMNDLIIILYVLFNAFLIFCIAFDFNNLLFIPYFFTTVVYWMCIYLIFLSVFHFAYYISKELKNAFFTSYAFLFILSFATEFISPVLFTYDTFDYSKIGILILISITLLVCTHFVLFKLGKGTCEVYEEAKG